MFCDSTSHLCQAWVCQLIKPAGWLEKHTYLAQGIPWSTKWFPHGEAFPLHSGWADPCDCPKCGQLRCTIFVSGGHFKWSLHMSRISVLTWSHGFSIAVVNETMCFLMMFFIQNLFLFCETHTHTHKNYFNIALKEILHCISRGGWSVC